MERLETLLKHDMGSEFNTRKTLNRSDKKVPNDILEQIESGSFTCEMIDELANQFPIFRYQTQITIHGEFDVRRSGIGQYTNLFQNGNLSLGVKYSAIDTEKIERIRKMLNGVQVIGIGKDDEYFSYLHNSQQRLFRRSTTINKENFEVLKKQYTELAQRISKVKIYGFVDTYIVNIYGFHKIILDVHPLAIPSDKVNELVYALTDMDEDMYLKKAFEVCEIRQQQKEKSERETLERNQKREAFEARRTEFLKPYKEFANLTEMVLLTPEYMVCKFDIETHQDENPEFVFKNYVFYRISGKGSFGKLKVQKAYSATFDILNLKWEEYKQMKLAEIKIKGYRVPPVGISAPIINNISREGMSTKIAIIKETKETVISDGKINEKVKSLVTDIVIVDYSDSSIAVFGNTFVVKDLLHSLGGKWNKFLTHNGARAGGWIYPKSKISIETIKEKLGVV